MSIGNRKGLENILLLSCRSSFLDNDKIYPPLANLYLHQKLKIERPHIKVKVTDDYNMNSADWLENIDGIGISIMTPQRSEAEKLLNFIKANSNAVVFAGGPHCRYYFDDMKNEKWDHIVRYDGFNDILKIVDGTDERVLTDLIGIRDYSEKVVKPNRIDNEGFLRGFNYILNGQSSTTMMTAQGCPMRCHFCEDAKTLSKWTPLHIIKEELDDIVSLGYKGVYIFDDLFAIAMPKVKPICEELKKRNLIYRCNGQANFFTKWGEQFAEMLADSGCSEIAFGHESGSQKILNNVEKQTTVQQNYDSVKYAKKYGIKVKSFLMLGLPGEDIETIDATERFIAAAGMDDFQLAIYYPYKGTQIRDAIDRGDKNTDIEVEEEGLGAYGQKGGNTECVVRTGRMSRNELLYHRDRLVEKYKPKSHINKWSDKPSSDHFFEEALKEKEYAT